MRRAALCLALLGASLPAAAQAPSALPDPGWVRRGVAELQALDKITARVSVLRAPVGEAQRFGTLTITVRACHARPPDESPDGAVWMEISDSRANRLPGGREVAAGETLFRGWMFAERPAVNMMEHPVYDLRLLACR